MSAMTCGLTATGWLCQQTWPYYLGVGLFAAHLGRQVCTQFVDIGVKVLNDFVYKMSTFPSFLLSATALTSVVK